MAFISCILYLNGNNPEQAKRIFLNSGMWNAERQRKKSSGYVDYTVNSASLKCTKVYDWDKTERTDIEDIVDMDEILQGDLSTELLAQARNNTLTLTTNKLLNGYLCKYLINFDGKEKVFTGTTHWDYDSAANGARFWLINQDDLIYLPEGDEWLQWNGKYWERCYDKNLLVYAEKVFVQLKHEAYSLFVQSTTQSVDLAQDMEEEALSLFKYASTHKGKKECLEMIEFSKSYFVKAQDENGVLQKVNANINAINLQNGVYSLEAMQFYPHSKEFYQTKIAGVRYEKEADCPLWKDMLETLLPNNEVRHFFQKAVGYIVSSEYGEKCMFILYGPNGNNGKTTITKTIYKLLGDYAVIAEKQTLMDSGVQSAGAARPDLLRLRDRRYVCISECEKSDKLSEGLTKNLTGGGMVICRTLHREPVEFPAMFKIVLDTNHPPQATGTDAALFRRIKVLNFDVTLPPEKIDIHFSDKLDKELSGILNWAIEGYRMYHEEGLEMPKEMVQVVKEYAEDMSPLDQWIKECVSYIPSGAINCYTSKALYQSYYNWCRFNHEYALGQRRFTQEINQKEWFKGVKKVKGYTQYLNIALNDIGYLFTEDVSDEVALRRKYNTAVNVKLLHADTSEKMQKISKEDEKTVQQADAEIVFGGMAEMTFDN